MLTGARPGRRWLRLCGLLTLLPVLALAAGLGAAYVWLTPDDLKPALVDAVRRATGRELRIGAPMRLTWSLTPTIEATDVTLANLPGGSRPDMARAERIVLTLSVPALLRRRIELSDLVLVGPNILFEQVGGRGNWQFEGSPGGDAGGADTPPIARPLAPSTPLELAIRRTQVQNGMVTWRLPSRTKVLGVRALQVDHPVAGGPIEAVGTFVYGDNQAFALAVSGTPGAGGIMGPWAARWRFGAFDAAATAEGTMDTAGAYDLQMEGTAGALEKLNALLPEMRLPALRGVVLSAHLVNGRQPGDIPVIGPARLAFTAMGAGGRLPGVSLGPSEVVVDKAGGHASLKAAGKYAGQAFSILGTVGVPLHPDEPGRVAVDVLGKGEAGTLGVKGSLGLRALGFDGLDAGLTLAAPDLVALEDWGLAGVPALTGVQAAGHVVVPAKGGSLAFTAGRLESEQGDLAGSGSWGPGGTAARLTSGRLDGDAMLAAFGLMPGPGRRAGQTVISDAPLGFGALRGLALDVGLGVANLRLHGEEWRGVNGTAVVRAGRLDGSMRMGGNTVTLGVDAGGAVRLGVDAPAVPLALLAREAGLPGPVSGTARVVARLQGAGGSLHALAGSLEGTGTVVALGGRMTNAAFQQLAGAAVGALGITVPREGETDVRCLGMNVAFRAGVGVLKPLALEATHLVLEGEGTVDLGRETVALRVRPLAQVAGSRVAVPVVVEGPFRAVSGRLEAGGLDKLGFLLDGVFGGDRATACVDAGLVPGR